MSTLVTNVGGGGSGAMVSSAGAGSSSSAQGCRDSELWELGIGLEFLSVAAGVTAKDKRLKEAKNQATTMRRKDLLSMFSRFRR